MIMFSWVRRGLRTGVLTTRYPAVVETMPTGFRGRPVLDASRCQADQGCEACVQSCLPGALSLESATTEDYHSERLSVARDAGSLPVRTRDEMQSSRQQFTLDYSRCIMCGLCVAACPANALQMTEEYELAVKERQDLRIVTLFSLHLYRKAPQSEGDAS
jgi:formate hydrogenlyase subunit 6/NADH:ubiquinone oxidoreductase subunit I